LDISVLEPDPQHAHLLVAAIGAEWPGAAVHVAATLDDCLRADAMREADVFVVGPSFEGTTATTLATHLRGLIPRRPVVLLPGAAGDRSPDLLTGDLAWRISSRLGTHGPLATIQGLSGALVRTTHDLVWSLDGEGRFVTVNDRLLELLGCRPEDLVGRHFSAFVHPDDLPLVGRQFQERRRGSRAAREARVRLCPGGGQGARLPRVVQFNALGVYDERNRFVGSQGSGRDITEEERHAGELRGLRSALQHLAELPPPGEAADTRQVLEVGLGALLSGTASPSGVAFITDPRDGSLIATTSQGIFGAADMLFGEEAAAVDLVRSALQQGAVFSALLSDGSPAVASLGELPLALLAVPLRAAGQVLGGLVVARPATQPYSADDRALADVVRHQLESCAQPPAGGSAEASRVLLHSHGLATLGQLLAAVAHELNNPLSAILLAAELQVSRGADAQTRERMATILAQAERCRRMTESIRLFARREAPRTEAVDFHAVIGDALEILRPALRRARIEAEVALDPYMPAVAGDRWALSQVMLNLLNNARQALEEAEGPRQLTVRGTRTDGCVRITVSDTGPGVPAANAERVFEPFYTTKGSSQGTGLGLSLSREIAENYGGTLRCEPSDGPGATFALELPVPASELQLEPVPEAAPPAPATRAPSGGRVLVVEDESSVLNALLQALRSVGYEAVGAEDGDDALDLVRREAFDAIVCDVRMPRMDGYRFYEAVQAHNSLLSRRIVFASGDTATPAIRTFIAKTGAVLLPKPCGLDEIHEALQAVLRR